MGPLTAEHIDAAGALLAARHAVERKHCPLLPAGPSDPAVAASIVAGTLRFCDGVAAVDDGRRRRLPRRLRTGHRPDDADGPLLAGPRSVMLVQGHAVAADIDPFLVYADLFGALAAARLEDGIIDHVVHVPILTPEAEAAWVALGFGRVSNVAVRDLAPTGRPTPPDVEVRIAEPDDLDVVDRLVDEESVFHAGSPIFRPYLRESTQAAVRAELAEQLGATTTPSSWPGAAASTLECCRSDRRSARRCTSPTARPTSVRRPSSPTSRRRRRSHARRDRVRVGTGRGHRAACLHFSTANRLSSSFWPGAGFVPAMAHLRRRLDELSTLAATP